MCVVCANVLNCTDEELVAADVLQGTLISDGILFAVLPSNRSLEAIATPCGLSSRVTKTL